MKIPIYFCDTAYPFSRSHFHSSTWRRLSVYILSLVWRLIRESCRTALSSSSPSRFTSSRNSVHIILQVSRHWVKLTSHMVSPLSMHSGLCWCNVANIWGHKPSYKVTERFACASTKSSITSRAVTKGGSGAFSPAAFIANERKREPKELPNRTGHAAELIAFAAVHIAALNACKKVIHSRNWLKIWRPFPRTPSRCWKKR